ncbi:hypothetical protein C8N37_101767 [Sphingobacterium faecium]|nr:hypothetical protein C8N37_101767 [Sphingobacterium faecium]
MELERFFYSMHFGSLVFNFLAWRCHLLFSDLNIPHQRHKIVFKFNIVVYTTIKQTDMKAPAFLIQSVNFTAAHKPQTDF